ncbi:LOW QUALITY PROTEIN: uncharacterized protein LOC127528741, partial [Erpetoichthys calabaricus]|uniref:LOW QUALITY PROTEIN: uncharacterized protein LOC127528741 n=1 Tax=Erpetoichthys calabaricus TaxID=27687 RepID=UPI0022344A22
EEDRAHEQKDLDLSHSLLPTERALGVQWCTETDSFKFQIKLQNKPATRCGILSVVSSVYDPLGFLAPALLPAKLILRDLCKEKFGWDEEVEVKHIHIQKWKKWMDDLQLLTDYKVNRCFKPTRFGTIKTAQMHHFADASEDGYGTVTYLVLTNEEGKKHCSFLMGKSRVAPLKQATIPRLELTAAVVAVKMDKMLKSELQMPLEESTFWTESITVLKYISNESTRFKTFVANRNVIRDHSQPSQWRYVTSVLNPADQASRGLSMENFLKSTTWSQDALSAQSYVTVSYVKPVLHLFQTSILVHQPEDTELTMSIKTKILDYLREKFDDPATQQLLDIASFLDPRFKRSYIPEEKYEEVKHRVVSEVETLQYDETSAQPNLAGKLSEAAEASPPPAKKGEAKLW